MTENVFTPGDRVMCMDDARWGVVKRVEWGGVFVDLDATETIGRELRVCREERLALEAKE